MAVRSNYNKWCAKLPNFKKNMTLWQRGDDENGDDVPSVAERGHLGERQTKLSFYLAFLSAFTIFELRSKIGCASTMVIKKLFLFRIVLGFHYLCGQRATVAHFQILLFNLWRKSLFPFWCFSLSCRSMHRASVISRPHGRGIISITRMVRRPRGSLPLSENWRASARRSSSWRAGHGIISMMPRATRPRHWALLPWERCCRWRATRSPADSVPGFTLGAKRARKSTQGQQVGKPTLWFFACSHVANGMIPKGRWFSMMRRLRVWWKDNGSWNLPYGIFCLFLQFEDIS